MLPKYLPSAAFLVLALSSPLLSDSVRERASSSQDVAVQTRDQRVVSLSLADELTGSYRSVFSAPSSEAISLTAHGIAQVERSLAYVDSTNQGGQNGRTGTGIVVSPDNSNGTTLITPTVVPKTAKERWGIFIGPYFGLVGGGINTEVANGRRTDVKVAALPEYGATLLVPFSALGTISFGLSLGMHQYSYLSRPSADQVLSSTPQDAYTVHETYNYLDFFPHLNLAGIVIGVGFQSSTSGTTKLGSDAEVNVTRDTTGFSMATRNGSGTNGTRIGADNSGLGLFYVGQAFGQNSAAYENYLGSVAALKIGTDIPVTEQNWGRVNFRFMASYPLKAIYSDARNYIFSDDLQSANGAWKYNSQNNPRPVSASLGLSVYFKIPIAK